jgi:TonB family protein
MSCLFVLAATQICRSQQPLTDEAQASLAEAAQLNKKVIELHAAKQYDEAIPLAKRELVLKRNVLGENNVTVALAYLNVGTLFLAKDDVASALEWHQHSLDSYTKAGISDARVARLLDTLTLISWRLTSYDSALKYGENALATKEKLWGKEHVEIANTLMFLIRVYEAKSDRLRAEPLYLRIIVMIENGVPDVKTRTFQMLLLYKCWLQTQKQKAEVKALQDRINGLMYRDGQSTIQNVGEVLNGRALLLVRPVYPAEAQRMRTSGTVIVRVLIDECGSVMEAKAQSGPSSLRRVSEDAALQAKFSPTLLSNIPVRVTGVIHYNFVGK